MEDQESLKPSAVVRQLPDSVQHKVDDLLADGVVPPGVVVGRILLPGDQLFRVEQLAVCAGPDGGALAFCFLKAVTNRFQGVPDLINHAGLEVKEDSPVFNEVQ